MMLKTNLLISSRFNCLKNRTTANNFYPHHILSDNLWRVKTCFVKISQEVIVEKSVFLHNRKMAQKAAFFNFILHTNHTTYTTEKRTTILFTTVFLGRIFRTLATLMSINGRGKMLRKHRFDHHKAELKS